MLTISFLYRRGSSYRFGCLFIFYCIHMDVFACMHVCIIWMQCPRRPEKYIQSLEVELHTVVSHHVQAGKQARGLLRRSHCSQLQSHLQHLTPRLFERPRACCSIPFGSASETDFSFREIHILVWLLLLGFLVFRENSISKAFYVDR